jgi:hypothetical protein
MANHRKEHCKAVQWIFRYLRGTSNVCLLFGKSGDGLVGFVDSDYVGDLDKRRSLTGYVFTIGGWAVSSKAILHLPLFGLLLRSGIWQLLKHVEKLHG